MPNESSAQAIIRAVARPTDAPCLTRFGHQRPRDTLAGSAGATPAASGADAGASLLTALAAAPPARQNDGRIWPVSPERGLPAPAAAGACGPLAPGVLLVSAMML